MTCQWCDKELTRSPGETLQNFETRCHCNKAHAGLHREEKRREAVA